MAGKLALVGDGLPVQGVEDFKGLLPGVQQISSRKAAKDAEKQLKH
jgi:hypothetical protein